MKRSVWETLETRPYLFVRSPIDIGLAYLFTSLAIDTGSLLQYALALFFLTMFLRNLIKGITYRTHGKR